MEKTGEFKYPELIDNKLTLLQSVVSFTDTYVNEFCHITQRVRDSDIVFVCYSTTDKDSFEQVNKHVNLLQKVDEDKKRVLVLMANKCDLEEERVVSTGEGKQLARVYDCNFFETSSLTSVNIKEAFHSAIRESRRKRGEPVTKNKECVLF